MSDFTLTDLRDDLAEPFPPHEISWKPEVTTKKKDGRKVPILNRQGEQVAGCTAHIDARNVMNRLDDVAGPGGWSDAYRVLNDGRNVECTLTVLGVSKADVGQINEGGFADPLKSAYSDALKRAAVKFGIGRHLYAMEMQWLPFDGYRITDKPRQPQQPPAKVAIEEAAPTPEDDDPQPEKPKDSRGATSPQAQAERKQPEAPKPNGSGAKFAGNVADARAWLEEKAKDGNVKAGLVADAATMTGLYNDREHVKNALNGNDETPGYDWEAHGASADFVVNFGHKWTLKAALKIFDWLMARKEAEE
jgi:hypothetical protein